MKMVKSVDHKGNAAIILHFYLPVADIRRNSRAPFKKFYPLVLKQPLVLLEIVVVEII